MKGLESKMLDPFKVLKKQLIKFNEKGKKTIIIIDELQALQEIYINGQRGLIQELCNFFVAITKESHLAHIIIASSDGYFIDTVYNDSKLRKTSKFYEVDYLPKSDVVDWLKNLEKYSKIKDYTLTDEEIEILWDTVGGIVWEIQYLLGKLFKNDTKTVCEDYKTKMSKMIKNCIKLSKDKKKILKKFCLKRINEYENFSDIALPEQTIEEILSYLVHNNYLYYNPVMATYVPQGRSVELGIKLYFEELK